MRVAYVRMPDSLHRRLERAAQADRVSVNVWVQRLIERALRERAGVSAGPSEFTSACEAGAC